MRQYAIDPVELGKMLGMDPVETEVARIAGDHPYNCRCPACLELWRRIGPDPDTGEYGPFSEDEITRDEREGKMKIVATLVKTQELQPGDLFSTAGPEYWDYQESNGSIGERVYIRTEQPTPTGEGEEEIYRIEIQREDFVQSGNEEDGTI